MVETFARLSFVGKPSKLDDREIFVVAEEGVEAGSRSLAVRIMDASTSDNVV
jgi:hypothetical protein